VLFQLPAAGSKVDKGTEISVFLTGNDR